MTKDYKWLAELKAAHADKLRAQATLDAVESRKEQAIMFGMTEVFGLYPGAKYSITPDALQHGARTTTLIGVFKPTVVQRGKHLTLGLCFLPDDASAPGLIFVDQAATEIARSATLVETAFKGWT